MLFDTHAHMDDRSFDEDREELLAALPGKGISLLMNPGCSYESSCSAIALAEGYDYIYAAVGSHPDVADEVDESLIEKYRALCLQHPKVKAIGEIGLDYHYEDIPRQIQKRAFRLQMELARELQLPVIVHEREAHEDGLRSWTNSPRSRACSTATPAPWRWPRSSSSGAGTSASPAC